MKKKGIKYYVNDCCLYSIGGWLCNGNVKILFKRNDYSMCNVCFNGTIMYVSGIYPARYYTLKYKKTGWVFRINIKKTNLSTFFLVYIFLFFHNKISENDIWNFKKKQEGRKKWIIRKKRLYVLRKKMMAKK